jgi:hypothetical protein
MPSCGDDTPLAALLALLRGAGVLATSMRCIRLLRGMLHAREPARVVPMPELPDVEGFRRLFAHRAAGKRVLSVWSDRSELRNTNPARLRRELVSRVFAAPRRHGKWLICPTGAPTRRPCGAAYGL